MQTGFFDLSNRYQALSEHGDPLERLESLIDWSCFLPLLNQAFQKHRKSPAGRKPFHRLMMFKILVLQSLYNLSDHQMEYQIKDRLSFMRFLGLGLEDRVPDEKTLWLFREVLTKTGTIKRLFKRFEEVLDKQGYSAACGTLVDASIVEAPRQRNSREDNKGIKEGRPPEALMADTPRGRQKDVDARWTKKHYETYYGYKDHIAVDTQYKLIRGYEVTAANMADIKCFPGLLTQINPEDRRVWADSAYYSEAMEKRLSTLGYESRVSRRSTKHWPEMSDRVRENRRRSKIRKRVEHVFGFMENSMGGKRIRCIGLLRARARIGLMNLVYNLCRFEQLHRLQVA